VKKASGAKKSTAARPAKAKVRRAPQIAQQDITHEDIAKLAYLLWESRGYTGGSPEGDWLAAEALLRAPATTSS